MPFIPEMQCLCEGTELKNTDVSTRHEELNRFTPFPNADFIEMQTLFSTERTKQGMARYEICLTGSILVPTGDNNRFQKKFLDELLGYSSSIKFQDKVLG